MGKININTADKESLTALPGIGEKLADAILQYRSEVGVFQSLDDLKKVKGVTERLFAQFSPLLSAGVPNQHKSKGQRVRVFGTPDGLFAHLPVPEGITEKKKTQVRFQGTKLLDRREQPLTDFSRPKNIIPGRTRQISVRIPLAASTPPGIYEMKIVAAESSYDATVEVLEKIDLQIQPRSITIVAAPNQKVEKVIYVTNRGNIPLDFSDLGAAILEGQSIECNTIRGVVRNFGKAKDLQAVLNLAAQELERIYEDAGALRFKILEGKQTIKPGETKRLTLAFTLPGKLRHSQQYFTRVPFYNSSLAITVFPSKSSS